jgi:hypothetical protein
VRSERQQIDFAHASDDVQPGNLLPALAQLLLAVARKELAQANAQADQAERSLVNGDEDEGKTLTTDRRATPR